MDKKRKLTFGVFCLLVVVFALNLTQSFAFMQKNIKKRVFGEEIVKIAAKPTTESQINILNEKLTRLETEEIKTMNRIKTENEKIRIAQITRKILQNKKKEIEKEKKEIEEEKKKLGLIKRPQKSQN